MILILGSNNQNTAKFYKTLNLPQSLLIKSEFDEYKVGHSSPQDLGSFDKLEKIATKATEVYFTNPHVSEFSNETYYYEYLDWLKHFQYKFKKVKNFLNIDIDPYRWNLKIPQPGLQKNDAVFIGCSFTEGVGLASNTEKYAFQVAEYFNLNCVNLGLGGSSNSYFFEVFSNLNFNDGQLVVLQLTVLERLRYCDENGILEHIRFAHSSCSYEMISIFHNKFLFYQTLTAIKLINQIAEAKKLKLAIWLDNYKEEHHGHYTLEQQMYFYNIKSFVPKFLIQDYCVDVGTDNVHPGPESNKNISKILIDFILKTYEI